MKKNFRKKIKARVQMLLVLLLAFAVLLTLDWIVNHQVNTEHRQSQSTDPSRSFYPDFEQKKFWSEHLEPIFQALIGHKYHIPEIQKRYDDSMAIIDNLYGRLNINISSNYIAQSHNILAGSGFATNGIPELTIVVPAIMDVYASLRSSEHPGWKEAFEYCNVLNVMHELDHIAYEEKHTMQTHLLPLDQLVEHERGAWARTCEYSIAPLVEKYQVLLTASEMQYYKLWVNTGRNPNNPEWIIAIRNFYKETRR